MAQPTFDQAGIHSAKVGTELQVAALVQIGQRWYIAIVTTAHAIANHIHLIGGAMVGTQARVLSGTTTKLRKHQNTHIIRATNTLHIADKTGNRIRHIRQQPAMQLGLLHMRVKRIVTVRDIKQARR